MNFGDGEEKFMVVGRSCTDSLLRVFDLALASFAVALGWWYHVFDVSIVVTLFVDFFNNR